VPHRRTPLPRADQRPRPIPRVCHRRLEGSLLWHERDISQLQCGANRAAVRGHHRTDYLLNLNTGVWKAGGGPGPDEGTGIPPWDSSTLELRLALVDSCMSRKTALCAGPGAAIPLAEGSRCGEKPSRGGRRPAALRDEAAGQCCAAPVTVVARLGPVSTAERALVIDGWSLHCRPWPVRPPQRDWADQYCAYGPPPALLYSFEVLRRVLLGRTTAAARPRPGVRL